MTSGCHFLVEPLTVHLLPVSLHLLTLICPCPFLSFPSEDKPKHFISQPLCFFLSFSLLPVLFDLFKPLYSLPSHHSSERKTNKELLAKQAISNSIFTSEHLKTCCCAITTGEKKKKTRALPPNKTSIYTGGVMQRDSLMALFSTSLQECVGVTNLNCIINSKHKKKSLILFSLSSENSFDAS